MRKRFAISIVCTLCCVVVSSLTHAQTSDPASSDNAVEGITTDIREDENSSAPTSTSPAAQTTLVSNDDATHHPETTSEGDAQQREQFKRALPHIIKAEGLFENDMFQAAAAEYQRANAILSGHPKYYQTLYNLGLCYERLNQYAIALLYYENYLRSAGPQAENRVEVENLIKTLKGLLATLQISVNVKAAVWVDGRFVGQAPGEVFVAGGRHRVEVRANGYETEQLEVNILAQSVRELTFQMKAIGRFQGIDPIYFWISSALAVTAIGVGSYFGINALLEDQKRRDAFPEDLAEPEDPQEFDELQEQLKDANQKVDDLQFKADLFLAIGGGFALSSVILFFLTDWDPLEKPPAVSRVKPSLSITTRLSERAVYGNLAGSF